MQRKVAYVFLYKNGIRERSVGIVKRYGTAEQPEVALELFGEQERKKRWRVYYFTEGETLREAAYLWGSTTERGKSEARFSQCRLCAEAGMGAGVVLLPERKVQGAGTVHEDYGEASDGPEQSNVGGNLQMERSDLREYLCARYDGKEMTADALLGAFSRKPEPAFDLRIASAKKLMEEIAKAAGGEMADEIAVSAHKDSLVQLSEREGEEGQPGRGSSMKVREKKAGRQIAYLEKLLLLNPPYGPCRRFDVEYSVRITPEELSEFPKEGKRYSENSFVLHAYYRYRHVLLGRRRRKASEDYVLLVPGNYDEKEAKLAELFGFPEFLPVKEIVPRRLKAEEKPEADGAASGKELFGYFCGKI